MLPVFTNYFRLFWSCFLYAAADYWIYFLFFQNKIKIIKSFVLMPFIRINVTVLTFILWNCSVDSCSAAWKESENKMRKCKCLNCNWVLFLNNSILTQINDKRNDIARIIMAIFAKSLRFIDPEFFRKISFYFENNRDSTNISYRYCGECDNKRWFVPMICTLCS